LPIRLTRFKRVSITAFRFTHFQRLQSRHSKTADPLDEQRIEGNFQIIRKNVKITVFRYSDNALVTLIKSTDTAELQKQHNFNRVLILTEKIEKYLIVRYGFEIFISTLITLEIIFSSKTSTVRTVRN